MTAFPSFPWESTLRTCSGVGPAGIEPARGQTSRPSRPWFFLFVVMPYNSEQRVFGHREPKTRTNNRPSPPRSTTFELISRYLLLNGYDLTYFLANCLPFRTVRAPIRLELVRAGNDMPQQTVAFLLAATLIMRHEPDKIKN